MYFQNLASLPLSHRVIELLKKKKKEQAQNGHSVKITKCWKGQNGITYLYNHRLLNALTFQSLILKEKILIRTQDCHTLIFSHDNCCSFSGKCINVTSAGTELQFGCHTGSDNKWIPRRRAIGNMPDAHKRKRLSNTLWVNFIQTARSRKWCNWHPYLRIFELSQGWAGLFTQVLNKQSSICFPN